MTKKYKKNKKFYAMNTYYSNYILILEHRPLNQKAQRKKLSFSIKTLADFCVTVTNMTFLYMQCATKN